MGLQSAGNRLSWSPFQEAPAAPALGVGTGLAPAAGADDAGAIADAIFNMENPRQAGDPAAATPFVRGTVDWELLNSLPAAPEPQLATIDGQGPTRLVDETAGNEKAGQRERVIGLPAPERDTMRVRLPDGLPPEQEPPGAYSLEASTEPAARYYDRPLPKEAADVADDGFADSFGKSLYNGLDPKRIAGNLLDYGGDMEELLGQMQTSLTARLSGAPEVADLLADLPLSENKWSDQKSKEWLEAAKKSDQAMSQESQGSFLGDPSFAKAGNLLGAGAASIVPVMAASVIGGPAAAVGVGAGLGVSATMAAGADANLSAREKVITATILAPIQGVLEALGVKDPGVARLAIRATLREAVTATGGKLTARALADAAGKVVPELAKRYVASGGRESVTETLQGEAEGGVKYAADKLRGNEEAAPGQGRYGITAI